MGAETLTLQEVILGNGDTITVEDVRARVSVMEPGIILFREIPHGSGAVLDLVAKFAAEDAEPFGDWVLITDLSEGTLPTSEFRNALVKWMRELPCKHVCFMQPGLSVVRVAVRFLVGRAGLGTSLTVHATTEEALTKARSVIASLQES